jgi:DNA modification methylase
VSEDLALELRNKAQAHLESIKSVKDGVDYKNKLLAIETWAKASKKDSHLQNLIAAQKMRTFRILGRLIKEGQRRGEIASWGGDRVSKVPAGNLAPRTLSDLGVTRKESSVYQLIETIPAQKFDQIVNEKTSTDKAIDELAIAPMVRLAKDIIKQQTIETEKTKRLDDISDVEIRRGDFKDVLADIYDIDAIITDPPYPKEYIQCFSELSKYASDHLKEDGFCIAYSGQYNLPEVISRMSEHLTYVWTFCLYHVGKKQLVNGVNIMCGWKPVLVFSRGRKKMRYSAYDVLISEQAEKHSHEWQQSESGVAGLIEIFTEPGQLVVDPFAGSGTFPKVAHDMGRNAIGAEIE